MTSAMELTATPKEHASRQASRRLPGLDALRGIAAMCVLAFHASIPAPALTFGGMGYLAVDFFFMLSGYVMARTYEQRFAEGYTARRFMRARYLRLWPVMAISALIGAPMLALELNDPAAFLVTVMANVMLIPVLGGTALFPVNGAAWSILAELSANLMHGLFLWRMRIRSLALVYAAMVAVLILACLTWGSLGGGASWETALVGLARALLGYSAGIILWRWWRDEPRISVNPRLAFIAMPAAMLLGHMAGGTWLFELAFVLVLCPLLIAGGLAYRGNNALLAWAGAISFPLYAINMPLMYWAKGLGLGVIPGLLATLLIAGYLAKRTGPQPVAKPALLHT